jgi:hypothetical protein
MLAWDGDEFPREVLNLARRVAHWKRGQGGRATATTSGWRTPPPLVGFLLSPAIQGAKSSLDQGPGLGGKLPRQERQVG